jgi:hypothetical protein
MRVLALAAVAGLVLSGPALAQGPISTAPVGGAAMPQPTGPGALPPPGTGYDDGPQIDFGPCGPEKVKPDGTLETKPHGEVEADIGTGGYRRVAGSVCKPIGQDAAIAVGASRTEDDQRYGRRR